MASVGTATVTVERGYLDTLIRRANLNKDTLEYGIGVTAHNVSVSQAEYDNLHKIARQYACLRQNLLRGGVTEETVALLSQDDRSIQETKAAAAQSSKVSSEENNGAPLHPITHGVTAVRQNTTKTPVNGHYHTGFQSHHAIFNPREQQEWADEPTPDDVFDGMDGHVETPNGNNSTGQQQAQRPQYDRMCTRTVLLMNLAEGTTHGDITNAVRGGLLLDIFLRSHERSATVSFLTAVDARGFYDHVRKHDLYIKNKRIEIRWNDRQFILPGHVANKVGIGASRNLVVRRCDSRVTEESVREDLDHIHNLVVIKVDFIGGSCYIKTNSVHNALFARTCMMSRQKYKGSKIDWDVDECAQPYQRVPHSQPKREQILPARKPMINRFNLLDLDDGDESDDLATNFQTKSSVDVAV